MEMRASRRSCWPEAIVLFAPARFVPSTYLLTATGFTLLSETFGVILFFAITQSLLREEKRDETERELALSQQELIRSRLMFLQAQIKPHFLFNTLNSIALVCQTEKAPRSEHLIGHLADFFRHALETNEPLLSIEKEIEFVDAYLALEKEHYGEDIQVVSKINLSAAALAVKVPVLLIQPVVENAIRHGLRKKSGKGLIIIEAFENEASIEMRVSDNGAGNAADFFENYIEKNIGKAEGHGIGVRNIHERLTRYFGKGQWLRFETALNQGTTVTITIPKRDR